MKKGKIRAILALILMLMMVAGCGQDPASVDEQEDVPEVEQMVEAEPALSVVASFYPYYDVMSKIGGERVLVFQMIPDGADPHSFEPSPRDLIQLEEAQVFLFNGLEMEHWLERVLSLLEGSETVLVKAGDLVEILPYTEHEHGHDDHDHDHHDHNHHDHNHHDHDDHDHDDHDHLHGEWDPHIWTDPNNMKVIGEKIMSIFVDLDPEGEAVYAENFQVYADRLAELDSQFSELAAEADTTVLLVSHSAFGYWANRYGFSEIAVTGISPHEEPNPGRLAELTELARDYKLEYIFFETLANPRTAEVLAHEAGLTPLMLYNLEGLTGEQREAGEDYFSLMTKNLETLRKALVND